MGDPWGDSTIESVLGSISDAVCGLDQSARITYWNEAATELFGYTRQYARGKHLDELISVEPAIHDRLCSIFDETTEGSSDQPFSESIELIASHGRGSQIPIEMSVTKTSPNEALCIARPSYEQSTFSQYFDLFQGSFFRRAIEESTDLIVSTNREGRILFANERYREFHDLEQPVHGKELNQLLPTEIYSEAREYFEQVLNGETVTYETERIGPDGNKHVLDVRYYPLKTKAGDIQGAVATIREITELKNRGRSLRDSWETYRDLLDGCPEPIIIHDTDGEILEVNEAACQRLGYREDTLLDQTIDVLCTRNRTDPLLLDEKGDDVEKEVFDAYCKPQDAEKFPVRVTASWIEYFGSGAVLCVAKQRDKQP